MAGMMSAAPMPSSSDHPNNSTPRLGASNVMNEPAPYGSQASLTTCPVSATRKSVNPECTRSPSTWIAASSR